MTGNPIVDFFNSNFALSISLYLVLLAFVCIITTFISRLSVVLKEKGKLSDGVVAGILLGVITSLPELVTCLTSVIQTKSGAMGFGDIIGSNLFDMFVLFVCLIVCVWLFVKKSTNKINTYTLLCAGLGTLFAVLACVVSDHGPIFSGSSPLVWHGFNMFSILIFISYALAIFFIFRDQRLHVLTAAQPIDGNRFTSRKSRLYKLDLKLIITFLVISSLLLIFASVIFTYLSSSLINYHWHMDASFGGSLLIGIATSLPEIVCCINLCLGRQYNMVIDTIVGSTTFNLVILTIANIAYACVWQPGNVDPMFPSTVQSTNLLVCCGIIIILGIAYLILNSPKFKLRFTKSQILAVNIPILSLGLITYIVYIILGFVLK